MPDVTTQEGVIEESVEEIVTENEEVSTEEEVVEDSTPSGPQLVSEHDQAMARMFERRSKQMEEAGVTIDKDESDTADVPENIDQDTDADDDIVDKTMVTLKVNGVEVQRSQAEVDAAGGVAAIQKQLSGDEKLRLAAEQRKEFERIEQTNQQIRQENQQLKQDMAELRSLIAQQKQEVVNNDSDETIEARKKRAKELSEKLVVGDADEVQEVIETVLEIGAKKVQQPSTPQINVNDVAQEVQLKIDLDKARNMFETKHADLNQVVEIDGETFDRRAFVNDQTKKIYEKHPDWMPTKIMAEAIRRTRKILNIPDPSAKQKQGMEKRVSRKKESVEVIPQASQRRNSPKPQKQPKTKREIFEEMNAARSHS